MKKYCTTLLIWGLFLSRLVSQTISSNEFEYKQCFFRTIINGMEVGIPNLKVNLISPQKQKIPNLFYTNQEGYVSLPFKKNGIEGWQVVCMGPRYDTIDIFPMKYIGNDFSYKRNIFLEKLKNTGFLFPVSTESTSKKTDIIKTIDENKENIATVDGRLKERQDQKNKIEKTLKEIKDKEMIDSLLLESNRINQEFRDLSEILNIIKSENYDLQIKYDEEVSKLCESVHKQAKCPLFKFDWKPYNHSNEGTKTKFINDWKYLSVTLDFTDTQIWTDKDNYKFSVDIYFLSYDNTKSFIEQSLSVNIYQAQNKQILIPLSRVFFTTEAIEKAVVEIKCSVKVHSDNSIECPQYKTCTPIKTFRRIKNNKFDLKLEAISF